MELDMEDPIDGRAYASSLVEPEATEQHETGPVPKRDLLVWQWFLVRP